MIRAILTAIALGVIVGQATLDYVFPEPPPVTEGYDPETWKPCPGRKPEKINKRKAVWYCGPSDAQPTVESSPDLGKGATSRSPTSRPDRSGKGTARGHR
jgi:hypothetical protein